MPELDVFKTHTPRRGRIELFARKRSAFEVCPKCATASHSVYDRRTVRVKDEPVRRRVTWLVITKRRFWCKSCKKPFTEPVKGIKTGCRTTERYRRAVVWACETFGSLKTVREHYRCSGGYLYKSLYPLLEQKRCQRATQWPRVVGIYEHYFRRHRRGFREFVTMLVDFKGRKLIDVVEGRQRVQLEEALREIEGRDNVRWVAMDLSNTYRRFATEFFPNAKIVADKFHVLRLLHPAINRHRKAITGDKRSLPVRRMLLKSSKRLEYSERLALSNWLKAHSKLRELYLAKEALHTLCRIRGQRRAADAFTRITDQLAKSTLPELKTLRRTLMSWRTEILNYFQERITNGRTEGFNNKAKLVKKRAYGYRSFTNYRLALLAACSP
ncbi:MAG: ISL3 family transposase [Myxococcota bacterium]